MARKLAGYGKTGSLDTTGYLEAKDLAMDAQGHFEIILSSEQPENVSNWLPMSLETRLVQVRQTRQDHKNEILADVTIERIDGNNIPRPFQPSPRGQCSEKCSLFCSYDS